jgi:hypothetical protein
MSIDHLIEFKEIQPLFIFCNYPKYWRPTGRYFQIIKNNKVLCYYGIVERIKGVAEAFLLMDTINGRVFNKSFFQSLFSHAFSLNYEKLYTWTQWGKLIQVLSRFKKIGIEKVPPPAWDSDTTKTWFLKRS